MPVDKLTDIWEHQIGGVFRQVDQGIEQMVDGAHTISNPSYVVLIFSGLLGI
jgi:hypothetical protein